MGVLLSALDQGLLRLTLDRPEKRNALSPELASALLEQLDRAAKDPAVRAVLLASTGPVFCAGGDIEAMRARRGNPLAAKLAQEELFGPLARAVLLLEKPVVADVQGDAYGAGLMLVLASDHAVAAPTARFSASFARVGLIPDTAGTWLLPKLLGLRAARDLALLAEPVDARRALELGLVSAVADDHEARALDVARRLARGPTRALGLAKRALVLGAGDTLESALAREAALQPVLFTTRDHAEAVDAFLAKREASFEGN